MPGAELRHGPGPSCCGSCCGSCIRLPGNGRGDKVGAELKLGAGGWGLQEERRCVNSPRPLQVSGRSGARGDGEERKEETAARVSSHQWQAHWRQLAALLLHQWHIVTP
ncbi:hypothetical protein chiPu_0005468 [Chiloscyllium punctatum]|uniref:Uncharacterized protein n=1 Tax=Chiloscyllium punctatum TaxID=137246 RepID=A0A401S9H0_CHIPU|nr:hypothetical protein [Chiloscyllium punctatum]